MKRLPLFDPARLSTEQRAVHDRIASGARGGVGGPFLPLLTSAELCARVEQLGVFIRYECSVPQRLRELAILVVGAHWQADYEWYAHAPIAARQGVPQPVIDAIGRGEKAPPFDQAADRAVHGFVRELLRRGCVSDAIYASVREMLGDKGAVELTGLVGYYSLLAMQLNVFEVEAPTTVPIPWVSRSG